MSIRSLIDDNLDSFRKTHKKEPTTIYLDPYYLSELAEEMNYSEEDIIFENALNVYAGCDLKMLEDGPNIIKIK
jgi:hypothetical protein